MLYKIEIEDKPGIFDAVGEGIKKDILDLGIKSVERVHFVQVYIVEGRLLQDDIRRICEELLVDRIAQDYSINGQTGKLTKRLPAGRQGHNEFIIEVAYNAGVMDPVEESTLKGIRDLGINSVNSIKTAKKYLIRGRLTDIQLKTISEKLLYNKLIQHIVPLSAIPACPAGRRYPLSAKTDIGYQFNLILVDLLSAPNTKLKKISKGGPLCL
ncbi:MAG: phosphoribosylformylglycinamidine synthase subunit PurS, partial [Candidatus Omnitrophota bacterium]|nr:phosphoribosylformylglycinamidine synthase subunit PurS [Candidatus Omnitrophota bacterium]